MQFSWPIVPPPRSSKGQLFGANRGRHTGLDMGTGGNMVLAPANGIVRVATLTRDSRGRALHIDHGTDAAGAWQTRYYHLEQFLVRKGQQVVMGQPIAVVGMSGLPHPWPHLHFEVRRNGVAIDPQYLLTGITGQPGV